MLSIRIICRFGGGGLVHFFYNNKKSRKKRNNKVEYNTYGPYDHAEKKIEGVSPVPPNDTKPRSKNTKKSRGLNLGPILQSLIMNLF